MATQTIIIDTAPTAEPITTYERIQIVDVLRGFALLGILLVNMALFKAPAINQASATSAAGMIDQVAAQAINLFAEGKFFTLFSFLFGFGFATQLVGAQARGASVVPQFARRLLVLLPIGIGHATLMWYGDILTSYVLIGFLLILFRNRAPRALVRWAAGILIAIAIYALQLLWSVWWLRHFRFGPAEWLWRTLTYGRAQPMRLQPRRAAVR